MISLTFFAFPLHSKEMEFVAWISRVRRILQNLAISRGIKMRKSLAELKVFSNCFEKLATSQNGTLFALWTMRKREREIVIGCRWSVFGNHLSIHWRSGDRTGWFREFSRIKSIFTNICAAGLTSKQTRMEIILFNLDIFSIINRNFTHSVARSAENWIIDWISYMERFI